MIRNRQIKSKLLQIITFIRKRFGYLDVLINNAAISYMNHFMLLPKVKNEEIFNLNVLANISVTRESIKVLKRSPREVRHVLNISSVSDYHGLPGQLAYSASKAAVESITRTASKELVDYNIRVNCLRLPFVPTSLSRTVGKARINDLVSRQTLSNKCSLKDVFRAAEYLTSENSNFITGETMTLGGV